MQLLDLIKPLDQMTDEELQDHLRNIRHNRNFIKPAAKSHAKKAAKKGSQSRVSKVENLVASMSAEDKAKLIAQLQQGDLF